MTSLPYSASPEVAPRSVQILAVVAPLMSFAAWLATGNPAAGIIPAVLIVAVIVALVAPSWVLVLGLSFLALVSDNTRERPMMGLWRSPLYHPGKFLYDTLEKQGIPGAKVFGIELLFACLVLLLVVRFLGRPSGGRDVDLQRIWGRIPTVLWVGCLVSFGAVILWEVWGLARGGNLSRSLLQFRAMVTVTLFPLLVAVALKTRKHVHHLLTAIVAAATIRASVGLWFWFRVMRHQKDLEAGGGAYVTTHSDTFIFVAGVAICAFAAFHRGPRLIARVSPVVVPLLLAMIVVNNRRIAFVGLGAAIGLFYLLADARVKRWFHRLVVVSVLPGMLYVAAGWNAGGGWASPVRSIRSMFDKEDSSSASRDVENFNLVYTARFNPMLGSGLGHEYKEKIRSVDLGHIFEAWKYLPHNNILWLLGAAGWLGFTLFFVFLVCGGTMAARLYRRVHQPLERVVALAFFCVAACYVMQGYGDMGLQSWTGSILLACTLGMVSVCTQRTEEAQG